MTEAADEVSSFEWRGAQYPVSAETIRAALAPVAAAEQELSAEPAAAAGASGSGDVRLVKLDRLGNAYAGALAAVQSAMANGAPCRRLARTTTVCCLAQSITTIQCYKHCSWWWRVRPEILILGLSHVHLSPCHVFVAWHSYVALTFGLVQTRWQTLRS